jgi:hypothetical protein
LKCTSYHCFIRLNNTLFTIKIWPTISLKNILENGFLILFFERFTIIQFTVFSLMNNACFAVSYLY